MHYHKGVWPQHPQNFGTNMGWGLFLGCRPCHYICTDASRGLSVMDEFVVEVVTFITDTDGNRVSFELQLFNDLV